VNATSACRSESATPEKVVKRFRRLKDSRSVESAVEAASIMMIGASINNEIGKTMPPNAAR